VRPNRDLLAEVDAGAFRRDLFFRIDGVELVIPPLRERAAMIGTLALRFLDESRVRANKRGLRFDHDAVAALESHAWPGNVRELRAVIERAVLLTRGDRIGVRHLAFARSAGKPEPPPPRPGAAPDDLSDAQCADRARLVRALEECGGNQSRAAKQLGISRTTMVTKLGLYRIRRPRT
jgi:DNA-binding NtrC family response regulator